MPDSCIFQIRRYRPLSSIGLLVACLCCEGCFLPLIRAAMYPVETAKEVAASLVDGTPLGAAADTKETLDGIQQIIRDNPDASNRPALEALAKKIEAASPSNQENSRSYSHGVEGVSRDFYGGRTRKIHGDFWCLEYPSTASHRQRDLDDVLPYFPRGSAYDRTPSDSDLLTQAMIFSQNAPRTRLFRKNLINSRLPGSKRDDSGHDQSPSITPQDRR